MDSFAQYSLAGILGKFSSSLEHTTLHQHETFADCYLNLELFQLVWCSCVWTKSEHHLRVTDLHLRLSPLTIFWVCCPFNLLSKLAGHKKQLDKQVIFKCIFGQLLHGEG